MIFTYHRGLIADRGRIDPFARAIAKVVRPGDVVVDIGAGTGILSCLAVRAGAARVYAIESGPVIRLARLVARENGLADRITFIEQGSIHAKLPELADVVVSETLGNFGLEEGLLDWLRDARRRFLKPGGRLIPRAVELHAVPAEVQGVHARIEGWREPLHGVRMDSLRDLAANNVYPVVLEWPSFLAAPASLGRVNLESFEDVDFRGGLEVEITGEGVLHGFGGWFTAELCDGEVVGNAAPSGAPTWGHRFLPAQDPVPVRPGDRVILAVGTDACGTRWSWTITRERPGEPRRSGASQSTVFGFPPPAMTP